MLFCVFSYLIIQITSSGKYILLYNLTSLTFLALNIIHILSKSFQRIRLRCFPDVSDDDVSVLRFRLDGDISLNCNTTGTYRTAWYHQNPDTGRLTLLLYTIYKIYKSYQSHRIFTRIGTNTASLDITGLKESDSGLYFCGTSMYSDEMHFDKPIRLVMEG